MTEEQTQNLSLPGKTENWRLNIFCRAACAALALASFLLRPDPSNASSSTVTRITKFLLCESPVSDTKSYFIPGRNSFRIITGFLPGGGGPLGGVAVAAGDPVSPPLLGWVFVSGWNHTNKSGKALIWFRSTGNYEKQLRGLTWCFALDSYPSHAKQRNIILEVPFHFVIKYCLRVFSNLRSINFNCSCGELDAYIMYIPSKRTYKIEFISLTNTCIEK